MGTEQRDHPGALQRPVFTQKRRLTHQKGSNQNSGEKALDRGNQIAGHHDQLSGAGCNEVGIGSPMVYASMQQYGGNKSDFPNLWGNIPARPFLGASEADKVNIADLVRSYMLGE